MKLAGAAASRYFARPDPARPGLLIFGADAMRVALKRQDVIAALVGPEGEAEMRLTRIPAGDLRRTPALLSDAVRGQSFFPGPRVAFVEDATDGLAEVIGAELADWRAGDAQIIVAAGDLKAKSALRKLFEGHREALCIGLYDDPPSREEIEAMLEKVGLRNLPAAAMADIEALSRALDPGDFRQTLEKIGLYKFGDSAPLTGTEIEALVPATIDTEIDEVLELVADGKAAELGLMLARLQGQGVGPVTLCIGAMRHFRLLHAIAVDPQGASMLRQLGNSRRRETMMKQARDWGPSRLETAIALLIETDLTLRSASRAPPQALVERALIRLAMMARR